MKFIRVIQFFLLMLLIEPCANAKGYKVTLAREKADTSSYIITGWNWGNKVHIDTARAKNGRVCFSSATPLNSGNYAICGIDGKKLTRREREILIEQLTKEMKAAAKILEFEHAAAIRDKIEKLRKLN